MAENREKKKALDLVSQSDVLGMSIMEFISREFAMHPSPKEQNKQKNGGKKRKQKRKEGSQSVPQAGLPKPPPCDDCKRWFEAADKAYKEEKYFDAYENLVSVIKVDHKFDQQHKDLKEKCIKRVATLLSDDVTSEILELLVKINAQVYREILDLLAKSGKWRLVEMLVTKFRQSKGPKSLSNFAKSMSVVDLVQEPSLCNMEKTRMDLINLLVRNGASLETQTSASALKTALRNSEWQVVCKLLDLKADPKDITLTERDTPLHAALQVALTIQPGNFDVLEKLKAIYDSDKNAYPDLSLSCQDVNGNTLLHIAVQHKFNQHSLRAVVLLCKWGVPVDLTNFAGLHPIQYLKSANDERTQYLVPQTEYGEGYTPTSSAQEHREKALKMLRAMFNTENDKDIDDVEEEEDDEEALESEEEEDDDASTKESNEIETEAYEEDTKAVSSSEKIKIDVKAFDDPSWDVECTEEVWNMLRTKREKKSVKGGGEDDRDKNVVRKERVPDDMKESVVKKIQQLASGDWRNYLVRRVKGVPDSLQLYKITLPHGACVIWELAVAFSPRRSETAENILAAEDAENTNSGSAVKGGRIYSELIRVWSIVLKEADFKQAVKKIISSHHRGEHCIIQKNLEGLGSNQSTGTSSSTRVPALYIESDLDSAVTKEIGNGLQKRLYPPASSRKNEFHILKFYSFSSSLVAAVLSNTDTKIDFPFRVTDIEHAIIHLDSKSPILLLGRSGTGKTTCCLYRLWSVFLRYWEQATRSKAPLLPRWDQPPQLDEVGDEDNQDEKNNEASAKTRAKSEERQEAQLSKKKEKAVDLMGRSDNSDDSDGTHSTDEKEEEKEDDDNQQYCHLHQLFVTKNPVLCSEVEKSFLKLRHAADVMERHNTTPKEPLPNTLQDVEELSYPLFLTSRQLLLMLDASVDGESFFPRDEDLGLKVAIPGWGTQEDIFNIIPLEHESDEEDDGEDTGGVKKVKHSAAGKQRKEAKCRSECTYEVFAYLVWPKIARKAQISCHPSLVWTEIMSFIKGSYEALHSEKGYLDKNQYLDLGKKRAPNFSGDRTQVYDAFELYINFRQEHFFFDEADLVFNIYGRLRTMSFHPWVLHEIYVDETQDFTQAELALLVSLCHDPNKMFLTGDTAQSIMRGISFRFSDLRSLFHYAKISAKRSERYLSAIKLQVPKKVYQLTHNYRSHTGILSLASAVLDILVELFPESFDRLKKDQGMFAGPKPVIIESSSPGDLALLLRGNKRNTSHIEFGAHQAILVVSEEAKKELPEELTTGIVLTIYESKGLEFDDILIYNFFKDSPAKKEWRVVTDFLIKLSRTEDKEIDQDNLVEMDVDILTQSSKMRSLQFDPNLHKILNSELKHLYTALTRARVNVWIFDEDDEKRGPMFNYFKARQLVTCMASQESEDAVEGQMFMDKKSTSKEWRSSGDNFMRQKLYNVAAKCYRKAEQFEKERLALAYQAALEASRLKSSVRDMREKYLQAGTQFVECRDVHRAALCFQNAKEHQLAALAFEKNGQFEEASKQYIQAKNPSDAGRCLEQAGIFGRAIRVLVDGELFDRAIDCVRKYEMTVKMHKKEKRELPKILIENKPRDIDTVANLAFRLAEYHCEKKDCDKAIAAIHRVSDIDIQIDFLQKKGYWKEAAEILRKDGRTEEAAKMMLKSGDTDKALEYSTAGFHKSLTAFIHLVLARKAEKADNFQLEDVKCHSKKALDIYVELADLDGQAQAKLLLGKHTLDMKLIKEAKRDFEKLRPPNQLGVLETSHILLTVVENLTKVDDCCDVIRHVSQACSILQVLLKPKANDLQRRHLDLSFFGLELDINKKKVTWYPKQQPLCKDILDLSLASTEAEGKKAVMQESLAVKSLATHYVKRIKSWMKKLKEALDRMLPPVLPCKTYQEGFSCGPNCRHMHRPYDSAKEEETALKLLDCSVLLDYYLQTGKENLGDYKDLQTEFTTDHREESKWDSVKELLTFIFPTVPISLRNSAEHTHKLINKLKNLKETTTQVERYLCFLWDNPGCEGQGLSHNALCIERCKSTDWIVQACFFVSLLGFKNKVDVVQKFQDLESWLYKSNKSWSGNINNYALYRPKKRIQAIGSHFVESFQQLTGQPSDPYEAIFAFTKMISPLGKQNNVSLMPELNHFVFWVEVYFCLTWFFIAKANQKFKDKTSFILPDTFLASLHLVNECIENNNKGKPPTVQHQVINKDFPKHLNKPGNFILKRQGFLASFLVGCNKQSIESKFSLIAYINHLCNQSPPNYLVAERIALLTAVLLLNIPGNFVHPDFELPIRREISKLEVTQAMPPRLASFLSQLKGASNYYDVWVATAAFLHKQGSGGLNKCDWQGRQDCPMQWQELSSAEYSTKAFVIGDVEELARKSIEEAQRDKARPQEVSSAKDGEMDKEDLEQDEEKMEAKMQEKEEEEKKKMAVEKIENAWRRHVTMTKLKNKTFRDFEITEMFRPYTVKDTQCGICKVEFSERDADTVDDTGDGKESSLQTKVAHEQSPSHTEKLKDYNSFKNLYISEIYHKIDKVTRFQAECQVTKGSEIYKENYVGVNQFLRALSEFNQALQEVFTKRSWSDSQALMTAFNNLTDKFNEQRSYIESEYNKSKQLADQDNSQKKLAHHEDEQHLNTDMVKEVDIDPTDHPVISMGHGRGINPVGSYPMGKTHTQDNQGNKKGRGRGRGRGNLPPGLQSKNQQQ